MTIEKAIRLADILKPNKYPPELKLQYINEVEGIVQTEIMLLSPVDIVTYGEGDMSAELLVKPPHDKLYISYLTAMFDFAVGEYNKYASSIQKFNTELAEYTAWYARTYHPADGGMIARGYYLSAYSIAVLHGFAGTEAEWVASLKGEKGRDGQDGKDGTDGASAYELAKALGYEGTLEQWLDSLKGEDGADGAPGKDGTNGTDGKDGNDGADGLTPFIGENGNWWIGEIDTGVPASGGGGSSGEGVPGVGIASVKQTTTSTEDGGENVVTVRLTDGTASTFKVRNGSKGSTGADGLTPHIGTNGNWWIGDSDTGVSAAGSGAGDGDSDTDKDDISKVITDTTKWAVKKHDESDIAHRYTLERKHKAINVSLPASGWSDKKQTVTVDGVTDNNTVIVGSDVTSRDAYSVAGVYCSAQRQSGAYVADDAQELYPYGVFESKESIEETVNYNSMSYDIRKDANNDYITGLYDVKHRVRHDTRLSLKVGTTYYFRFTMRLNEAAAADENYMRVSLRLDDNDAVDIYPWTANELGWVNDAASVPTFKITKEWRTIEYTYTPTASDVALGNDLKIRYYMGPHSNYQHPFDLKGLFVGTDTENNLLTGVDFSVPVDLDELFDTEQTLVQEAYLHCKYDNDTPVVLSPFNITLEADATYQATIRTKLHDTSYIGLSNLKYAFMSGGHPLTTRMLEPIETAPMVMMNVGGDSRYDDNAWASMDAGSFEKVALDDGTCCAKLSYFTDSQCNYVSDHKLNYYAMFKFTSTGAITSEHKYIRVTYMTENTNSYELELNNNALSQRTVIASDTSVSNGNWITTEPITIDDAKITRYISGNHNTFEWSCKETNSAIYIKEVAFFTSLQQAYEYYGEEIPSDVSVDTTVPEDNTGKYFHITKDWRTVTIRITPDASQIVKGESLTLSLERYPGTDKSTKQPFDIDFVSIKRMNPVGTLTFECEETPTEDLTANIVILGG